MTNVVVAFPREEDAYRIRDILIRSGYEPAAVCTTAAAALSEMNLQGSGILICGYKLPDMFCRELRECMPAGFEMLLIASARAISQLDLPDVLSVSMPLSVRDLTDTLDMMVRGRRTARKSADYRPRKRSRGEKEILDKAKQLLMVRNHMTESEAHRYIQKRSMDNGTNLVETAQMILTLMS